MFSVIIFHLLVEPLQQTFSEISRTFLSLSVLRFPSCVCMDLFFFLSSIPFKSVEETSSLFCDGIFKNMHIAFTNTHILQTRRIPYQRKISCGKRKIYIWLISGLKNGTPPSKKKVHSYGKIKCNILRVDM